MGYTDAVSRISQLQAEVAGVRTAFDPTPTSPTAASTPTSSTMSTSIAAVPAATAATPSSTATPAPSTSTFATALAQAQAAYPAAAATATPSTAATATGWPAYISIPVSLPAPASGSTGAQPIPATTTTTPTTALPANAQSMLTSDQQQFASRLAAETGLDPGVISAWLLAEESGGAAQSRQAQSNNDWLNIGYTDSGTYGSADSIWGDPVTAADATAGWLKGQDTIPGYGTASSGIRSILSTAGSSSDAQIAALQQSGWASSGYPDLPGLYSQVTA